jgi:transglutaminase-like putative cysteine protease
MRILVKHETTYRYESPAKSAIQKLLLTPRNHYGQHLLDWRIDISRDVRLRSLEDAFGNVMHSCSVDGPIDQLSTLIEGEVETFDTSGVVRGAVERFPPALYLRETQLTVADDALRDFARETAARNNATLDKLHALLGALYETLVFDTDATHSATTAIEAFERKQGVCQDFAHIFIACARVMNIPARYVSGYFLRSDGCDDQAAGHAWTEAFVDDFGWVGFDPAHGLSPGANYVRVAIALDYLGAAPLRGAHSGGAGEELKVHVRVSSAQSQMQSQS